MNCLVRGTISPPRVPYDGTEHGRDRNVQELHGLAGEERPHKFPKQPHNVPLFHVRQIRILERLELNRIVQLIS